MANNNTNGSNESKQISTFLVDGFRYTLGWVSANIVPIVGLLAILALAVIGAMQILNAKQLSHEQRLLISVVAVGSFAALGFGTKKNK